jgi:hypothetical protein
VKFQKDLSSPDPGYGFKAKLSEKLMVFSLARRGALSPFFDAIFDDFPSCSTMKHLSPYTLKLDDSS